MTRPAKNGQKARRNGFSGRCYLVRELTREVVRSGHEMPQEDTLRYKLRYKLERLFTDVGRSGMPRRELSQIPQK
jgi:hypothetical protein